LPRTSFPPRIFFSEPPAVFLAARSFQTPSVRYTLTHFSPPSFQYLSSFSAAVVYFPPSAFRPPTEIFVLFTASFPSSPLIAKFIQAVPPPLPLIRHLALVPAIPPLHPGRRKTCPLPQGLLPALAPFDPPFPQILRGSHLSLPKRDLLSFLRPTGSLPPPLLPRRHPLLSNRPLRFGTLRIFFFSQVARQGRFFLAPGSPFLLFPSKRRKIRPFNLIVIRAP